MDGEKPKKDDGWKPSRTPIPEYSRTLQRLKEIEAQEKLGIPEEEPAEFGLPERPHKRIQEKFRRDREAIEASLNSKGDSLYGYKKVNTMQQPQWSGGPGMEWDGGPARQAAPWPGWPAPPTSSFGGWGNPPQDSPFGRGYGSNEPGLDQEQERAFGGRPFGARPQGKPNTMKDESLNEGAENNEFENENSDNEGEGFDPFKKASEMFMKGKTGLDGDEGNDDAAEFSDNSYDAVYDPAEFGRGPLSSRTEVPTGDGVDQSSTTMTGEAQTSDQPTDLSQRPKRQLKEEFMRDRELLEAEMNAKGDSIYRKASDPLPAQPQGPMQREEIDPFTLPERRILSTQEIRAQMALEKIARAAIKASRKKGRKGKASIVFI